MTTTNRPKAIPRKMLKTRTVDWWGGKHQVTPAKVDGVHGNGKVLMVFAPLCTRPNYYLIRVDSICLDKEAVYDALDDIEEIIESEYSEKETERGFLAEDLRAQGIEPTAENTDLAGNEDRLGWPVLSLDNGVSWELYAPGEW
jgi:hypothetical protein